MCAETLGSVPLEGVQKEWGERVNNGATVWTVLSVEECLRVNEYVHGEGNRKNMYVRCVHRGVCVFMCMRRRARVQVRVCALYISREAHRVTVYEHAVYPCTHVYQCGQMVHA